MRKLGWLWTTAILTLGFGFGHAGCYTSGIPGGLGAGGASVTAGGAYGAGGTDSDASTGGSQGDGGSSSVAGSGTVAPGASIDCENSLQCSSLSEVCDPTSRKCVDCIDNNDCTAVTQRCANHVCLNIVTCTSDRTCYPNNELCDKTKLYCVQCLDNSECSASESCNDGACIKLPPQADAGSN
jgi:hypothetical protein